MARKIISTQTAETRTVINPNAVRSVRDGTTMYMYREWQQMELRLDEYDLTRVFGSLAHNYGQPDQPGDDELRQRAGTGYADFTPEEREAYQAIADRQIVRQVNPDSRRLVARGEIVGKRTIRVLSAESDGVPQTNYDRSFRWIHVNLRTISDQDHVGALFVWDTLLHGASPRPFESEDDYLLLDVVVRREMLENLFRQIDVRSPPTLRMHIEALLLQDHAEASLSENHYSQMYVLIEGTSARAYVDQIAIDVVKRRKAGDEDEVQDSVPISKPTRTPGRKSREGFRSSRSPCGRWSLR